MSAEFDVDFPEYEMPNVTEDSEQEFYDTQDYDARRLLGEFPSETGNIGPLLLGLGVLGLVFMLGGRK